MGRSERFEEAKGDTRKGDAESMRLADAVAALRKLDDKVGKGAEPVADVTLAESEGKEERRARSIDLNAPLTSLATRIAWLGVRGKLFVDNSAVLKSLSDAGPVGEQLVERMGQMKARGWTFGNMGFNDPWLKMEAPGLAERVLALSKFSGYHYDWFQGERIRRVAYNGLKSSLSSMLGVTYGSGDGVKHSAVLTAHELAHEDGTLYEYRNWKALPLAEQQTLARRLLSSEARAIVTQLHVAQQIGDMNIDNNILKAALRRRDLGGFVYDAWKGGSTYGSFSTIDRNEAVRFVNQYLEDNFGRDLVDRKGRIRAFDIDAGLGKQVGVTSVDGEMKAKMNEPGKGVDVESRLGRFLTETRSGRAMMRGTQALGAIGLWAMATDLHGAYQEGVVPGLARTARVGLDWAAFEGGSYAGGLLAEGVAVRFAESRWPLVAIPVITIGGGMFASAITDRHVASKLENVLRSTPEYIRSSSAPAMLKAFAGGTTEAPAAPGSAQSRYAEVKDLSAGQALLRRGLG